MVTVTLVKAAQLAKKIMYIVWGKQITLLIFKFSKSQSN